MRPGERVKSSPAGSPPGFRELFRYRKGQRTRAYGLKAIDENVTELWVVASGAGRGADKARRLARLETDDDLAVFLDDVEQQLRCGHWSPA